MEQTLKDQLLDLQRMFSASSGLSAHTVWARAAKDARFMSRIERGKGFTVRTFDNAISWFSANWPEDLIWPAHIARPAANPADSDDALLRCHGCSPVLSGGAV